MNPSGGSGLETSAAKQALDTGRIPVQPIGGHILLLQAKHPRNYPLLVPGFSPQQTQTPQGQYRRPHATVPPTCHLFFTTYSPTLGFALSIALFPLHFPAMASLSCCCLTAPDGYCRTDEVPSLSSENRHQPFSQRCFSFLLEISIRDQVRLCPQNTDLVHLKTSQ